MVYFRGNEVDQWYICLETRPSPQWITFSWICIILDTIHSLLIQHTCQIYSIATCIYSTPFSEHSLWLCQEEIDKKPWYFSLAIIYFTPITLVNVWLSSVSFKEKQGTCHLKGLKEIIISFWETVHLPLPEANINTYFSRRTKYWLRGGVAGQFPRNV